MYKFIIQKYDPQRDKAQIELLLLNDNYLMERFHNDEDANKDNILVALIDSTPIGFLSFSGLGRKQRATVYVSKEYEALSIGSMLINEYESMLKNNEQVEHTVFACSHNDTELVSLFENNGYRLWVSGYIMERIGEPFPSDKITVRNYEENDYLVWDRICELAFYHMRKRIGMYPPFFYKPVEWEREKFTKNKDNMFVMIVDNAIAAIGKLERNKICTVAVSIEHQSRGYGRAFVKFLVNEIIRRGEEKVTLEVAKGNFAKTLYESLGFKETALYHNFIKYFRPDTRLCAPPDNY